ncbi:MAG: HNH endonuclease [Magnetospirillum sp.]|nr:HNH endonuclease [Magnetospirillum sp.]
MTSISRPCLRIPVPQILEAARLLKSAAEAHLRKDKTTAARLFADANMTTVREWTESIWGKHRPEILCKRDVPDSPPHLAKADRIKRRMPPSGDQKRLIAHYGYQCAFCEIPLIHPRVRKRAAKLYPEAVPWGRTNPTQHAAFQAMWLQFDHVLPHARGGDNRFENLVITCAPCNFGRMNYTLTELGLADPRERAVKKTSWNGLEELK